MNISDIVSERDSLACGGTPVNTRCAYPGHMCIQLSKLLAAVAFLNVVQLAKQPHGKLVHKRHQRL